VWRALSLWVPLRWTNVRRSQHTRNAGSFLCQPISGRDLQCIVHHRASRQRHGAGDQPFNRALCQPQPWKRLRQHDPECSKARATAASELGSTYVGILFGGQFVGVNHADYNEMTIKWFVFQNLKHACRRCNTEVLTQFLSRQFETSRPRTACLCRVYLLPLDPVPPWDRQGIPIFPLASHAQMPWPCESDRWPGRRPY
jgi:hypothetical protein